ncbi:MAG: hypothetical protein IPJ81_02955 [Chitinophagaceae bacterium]|nr:hypothetical protein [Chitinophagaceae bacterium]
MPQQNEKHISADIENSLEIINRFLNSFPPEEVKRISWNLLIYAFGSKDADGLSNIERSNMLYFYEQINKVCEALVAIDEKWGAKE